MELLDDRLTPKVLAMAAGLMILDIWAAAFIVPYLLDVPIDVPYYPMVIGVSLIVWGIRGVRKL
jgi:hypothetical protein